MIRYEKSPSSPNCTLTHSLTRELCLCYLSNACAPVEYSTCSTCTSNRIATLAPVAKFISARWFAYRYALPVVRCRGGCKALEVRREVRYSSTRVLVLYMVGVVGDNHHPAPLSQPINLTRTGPPVRTPELGKRVSIYALRSFIRTYIHTYISYRIVPYRIVRTYKYTYPSHHTNRVPTLTQSLVLRVTVPCCTASNR